MTDGPSDSTSSKAVSETEPPRQAASSPAVDDFQPDVPPDLQVGTVGAPQPPPLSNGGDLSTDPALETTRFDADRDPVEFDAPREP